jgi:hypothetical protein
LFLLLPEMQEHIVKRRLIATGTSLSLSRPFLIRLFKPPWVSEVAS